MIYGRLLAHARSPYETFVKVQFARTFIKVVLHLVRVRERALPRGEEGGRGGAILGLYSPLLSRDGVFWCVGEGG